MSTGTSAAMSQEPRFIKSPWETGIKDASWPDEASKCKGEPGPISQEPTGSLLSWEPPEAAVSSRYEVRWSPTIWETARNLAMDATWEYKDFLGLLD